MIFSDDNSGEDYAAFDLLRTERQAQYGLAIAHIQEKVGLGTEYANEVARAVLSPAGGYCHLHEMPEEFTGVLGTGVTHRLISEAEAHLFMAQVKRLTDAVLAGSLPIQAYSLYALYAGGSLRTRRAMFVCDCPAGEAPFQQGQWQPETLPRFCKLRVDVSHSAFAALGLPQGGLVFLLPPAHTDDGRCLLVTITRTPGRSTIQTRPASLLVQ